MLSWDVDQHCKIHTLVDSGKTSLYLQKSIIAISYVICESQLMIMGSHSHVTLSLGPDILTDIADHCVTCKCISYALIY